MDVLTIFAWAMIIIFLVLIIKKKLSPFTALIAVPVVFALLGAFMGLYTDQIVALHEVDPSTITVFDQIFVVGNFVLDGIKKTSTTGIMLLFAIFYFALMLDAGMFDPITKRMVKFAGGDPLKVIVASAVIAAVVSLNGDGTTTTLIACTAFIPLYKKLNINLMNLGVVVILMNTIMNLLPWGGPTARVISVLAELNGKDSEILMKLAPGMALATLYMLGVAVYLGLQERKRLGIKVLTDEELASLTEVTDEDAQKYRRPHLFWPNLILTISLIACLMIPKIDLPSVFLFLVGTVIALLMNYPNLKDQKTRLHENSGDAVAVVILVLAAGVFTGIFTQTGMSDALAVSLTKLIPTSLGRFWGLVVAFLSAPGTYFLSNDAFYYGVLPVLVEAGMQYGWTAMELGIASLLGQAFHLLSPLVAFIYLLLQMTGLEMGAWQKESGKWAIGIFAIFIFTAGVLGYVPFMK